MIVRPAGLLWLLLAFVGVPSTGLAQEIRGVVVDQTGLPLPGATVDLLDGANVVATWSTQPDGTFVIDSTR